MRKLTGIFFAAGSAWIGMWLGIWEFYPVQAWTDEWWRPVVFTSGGVGVLMVVNAYLLLVTREGGQMRKLTGIFFAAESAWIGMWLGIWEFYPVQAWTDEWRRPVVFTSGAVGVLMVANAYHLLVTREGAHDATTTHEENRGWLLHAAKEVFLQVSALFLAVEASVNILVYLHMVEPDSSLRAGIEFGSVFGTSFVLVHFLQSLFEARYLIVSIVVFIILLGCFKLLSKVGESEITVWEKLRELGCRPVIDLNHPGLTMDCEIRFKTLRP